MLHDVCSCVSVSVSVSLCLCLSACLPACLSACLSVCVFPGCVQSREHILRIHSRKMNLMRGINLRKVAEKMSSASGAECKGVCTEAGMFALRERRVHVTQEDFDMAVAKIMKKDSEKDMSVLKLFK